MLGIDGYLGWALTLRLIRRGHEVFGIDNFYTRKAVAEVGSDSALPILSMKDRIKAIEEVFGTKIGFVEGDVTNYDLIKKVISEFKPDAIVHFAEQRSAPYSMIDVEHAKYTIINNLTSINLEIVRRIITEREFERVYYLALKIVNELKKRGIDP